MAQSELKYGCQNGNGFWINGNADVHKGFDLMRMLKENNVQSIPEIMDFSAKTYKDKQCLATRTLVKRHLLGNDVTPEKLELGDYIWMSYQEVQNKVLQAAQGLKILGFGFGDKIAILSETRAEWLISALGAMRNGCTIVSLYTNLNESGLIHALSETEVNTVLVSYSILPSLIKILPHCEEIKRLIVFEDQMEEFRKPNDFPDNIEIIGFKDLQNLTEPLILNVPSLPKPKDLAIIMYTSGSTGNPKGVELSHENVMCAAKAMIIRMNLKQDVRYLTILPLAHVMELCSEVSLITMGAGILYSSIKTMTDDSPNVMPGTLGDAKVGCPTLIITVPLVLDRIIKGIAVKMHEKGKVMEHLYYKALEYKQNNPQSFVSNVLNVFIFNKIKAILGGQVEAIVSGSAPLTSLTYTHISTIFDCTIQNAYGATETAASISSMLYSDERPGHCGAINIDVFAYLESWEEGGYQITDKSRPIGEIIVGGPVVAKGYFKLPEETSAAFFEKNGIRWFRTGDIGEFDETGCLCIIDRKNDLVKLKNGQFIALGQIESVLKTNELIDNICVYADPYEDFTIAIVVPAPEAMTQLISSVLRSEVSTYLEDLYEKTCIRNAVKEELYMHGKQQGLTHKELPASVILTPDLWLPENGLVTTALKIKRHNITKRYKDEIAKAYAELNNIDKISLKHTYCLYS